MQVPFIVCCRCTISLVSINGKFTVNQKEMSCYILVLIRAALAISLFLNAIKNFSVYNKSKYRLG